VEGLDYLESFTVAAIDAALAAQNAVVAAESLGLGTVYIGALRNQPEAVAQVIDLPPRAAVVFGLVVGHPDPALPAAVKPRLPREAILHHDSYRLGSQRAPIAAYDETARAFQAAQGAGRGGLARTGAGAGAFRRIAQWPRPAQAGAARAGFSAALTIS
jgi:hypothetical protein